MDPSQNPQGYGRGGRGAALLAAVNSPIRKPGEAPAQARPMGRGGLLAMMQQGAAKPATVGRGAAALLAASGGGASGGVPMGRGIAALQQQAPMGRGMTEQQAPLGRGMIQAMGRGSLGPSANTQAQAAPVGRGMQALAQSQATSQPPRPMGRGMMAQLMAKHTPAAAGTPPPASQAQAAPQRVSPPTAAPTQRVAPPTAQRVSPPLPQQHAQQQQHVQQAPPPQAAPHSPGQEIPPPAEGEEGRRLTTLEYGIQQMNLNQEAVSKPGSAGMKVDCKSNYIKLTSRTEGVYQYAVSFNPIIESMGMRRRLLLDHIDKLSPAQAFDGAILFLPVKLEQPETFFQSDRPTDGQPVTVKVKLVKVVPHTGCIPVYNIVFRNIMKILDLCQVGRHYYDPHKPPSVPQHRLEVWPGYITTIAEFEGGLMLQCDVSHRVLRTETVLDNMRDTLRRQRSDFKAAMAKSLIGTTVLTRYNNSTYRVDDIDWEKNPASTFSTRHGDISFADYYFKTYKKTITDMQQPLLVHRPKKKDYIKMGRRPKKDGEQELVCLVPEFSFMTGLTDEMRNDFRVMKDIGVHTRITPNQRENSLRKFTTTVNSHPKASHELEKWGLRLETDTIRLPGRCLPREKIILGGNRTVDSGPRADWSRAATENHVITPVDISCWMLIYTTRDKATAVDYVQCTMQEAPKMGIRVGQPIVYEIPNDRCETFVRAITDNLNNNVQLVVIIFPTSRDDRYNAVKKICNVERPVPSQVIISRTISKKPKLRSVCQKIILQINAKLGGELWGINIPMKNLMVCGVDVYHDGGVGTRSSYAGFVASLNEMCTRWMSRTVRQMPGQELMDGLKMAFLSCLREYHKVNHALPEKIIIYRDGVGDGQLNTVRDYEVSQLESCFQHFGETYCPKFAFVVVQKRINTRIFKEVNGGLDNPAPGTIIDHTITRKSYYDFFLVSQHVGQGTVSPTHYIVIHDSGDFQVDHLQRISYKMTHLYYNWPGTVRVPAPCQYAHRLAYHVGNSLRKMPAEELCNRLFYL